MARAHVDFRERSFAFACEIVRLYLTIQRVVPESLARQVLRAGTSIGANLEEAKSAQSRRDLAAKFSIALREARETSYWLRLILATGMASEQLVRPQIQEADELIAILTTTVRRLQTLNSKL